MPGHAPVDAATRVAVLVDAPQHSGLQGALDYRAERPHVPGSLLRVPFGRREVLGIVWEAPVVSEPMLELAALRPVGESLDALPPLPDGWRALVDFAAAYYQRSPGELALAVLPPELRGLDAAVLARRVGRLRAQLSAKLPQGTGSRSASGSIGSIEPPAPTSVPDAPGPMPSGEQSAVLAALAASVPADAPGVTLLHGATGSGKTEIYLRESRRALDAGRQALVLVPEINLTPQLEARFIERFPGRRVVSLHSGLTPARRLKHWLMALLGEADLVLGTRLAVFAPLPRLGLIVVDEEHDPSYKQQEGARYSARDLAVVRGRIERVPVLLGSATPSLESWHNALAPAEGGPGRYRRLTLASRIGGGALPAVRLVDMGRLPRETVRDTPIAPPLLAALQERLSRGEQSLVFLNRRGYAPVLHCLDCAWKSACAHCSAWRVFHKRDRTLRCHHCGFTERVPRACPECGNADIQPVGRGTERLEEQLGALLPGARLGRIDADTTRRSGALEAELARVHAGEIDVLVGTQMIAKGHDFRRITLVAAVNPDAALFSSDFRGPERLFALLLQATGRAGRDAGQAARAEMWVQTWHPQHPLYAALRAHDYESFARQQLAERLSAGLPPHAHLAILRADARSQSVAQAWLQAVGDASAGLPEAAQVTLYPPVPLSVQRVADVERAQMLVESASRPALQRFLAAWGALLQARRPEQKGVLRWAVDVDPLAI
ncbi:MAG: primosomal protein N' [Methylibium sp.]|uniref:replication restart helicase PriA n=1 Tax=Methylibium sp. TaxID=2067992 RepID=UPI00182778BB|nr:primosomal protein N' [Methylibium sp.]MBA3596951.1 primosomal protein N' [Methylibium sp.]